MKLGRRSLLQHAATKVPALTLLFKVAGVSFLLTPRQARAQQVPLKKLSSIQAHRLEILAEALVPGAHDAGVIHFIDHQLAADPDESLLIVKYFGIAPPHADFYTQGIQAAADESTRIFGKPLEALAGDDLEKLAAGLLAAQTPPDQFPLSLFGICLRSDAVDVVYGTPEGFARLDIPYMEHIRPPEGWDA